MEETTNRIEVAEVSFDAWNLGQDQTYQQETVEQSEEVAVVNAVPEQQDVEVPVEQEVETEEVDDSNYSASALILKAYVDEGLSIDPKDINPNLSSRELLDTIREKIREELKPDIEQEYVKQGYNDEFKQTIEFLKNGGTIEELKQSFGNKAYSQLDIDNDDDNLNKETVIKAFYMDKGFSEDKAEQILSLARDNDTLYEDAAEAQGHFVEKDQYLIQATKEQAAREQAQVQEQYDNNKKALEDVLKGKKLGNIDITDKEAKDIRSAIYDQTEVYKYTDEHGKEKQAKMTKYEALLDQYNKNPEWQLTFIKLLLDGFKFDKIANKVVKARDGQINDVLGAKLSNTANREKAISKNNNYNYSGTNQDSRLVGEINIK